MDRSGGNLRRETYDRDFSMIKQRNGVRGTHCSRRMKQTGQWFIDGQEMKILFRPRDDWYLSFVETMFPFWRSRLALSRCFVEKHEIEVLSEFELRAPLPRLLHSKSRILCRRRDKITI